uniref:Uncharacterized protein n=1 Tax=viral metagenome TaxID=1070528 RepID=A0A6C0EQ49_9ZZZZ
MNFNNVLKSKYLYYAAVALMVINVLGYVSLGSIECVLVLGGAAYLANQFTKNRTVDIFIGLFVSNILFGCGRLKEGFDGGNKTGSEAAAEAARKLNSEASDDIVKSETCSDGSAKVNGECADVKAKAANQVMAAADAADNADKKKAKATRIF